jgi:hypothetical protein
VPADIPELFAGEGIGGELALSVRWVGDRRRSRSGRWWPGSCQPGGHRPGGLVDGLLRLVLHSLAMNPSTWSSVILLGAPGLGLLDRPFMRRPTEPRRDLPVIA